MSIRTHLSRVAALGLASALAVTGLASAAAADEVAVADAGLAACLRDALGLNPDGPITVEAVAQLEELWCDGSVASLEGLQHATGLRALEVYPANRLTDLVPISALTGLEYLGLPGAGPVDLGPVAGLTGLVWLDLFESDVTVLPHLDGFDQLLAVDLGGTRIADLSPLGGARSLVSLWADGTPVTDISVVASLGSLTELVLADAGVEDLTPMRGHPRLEYVDMAGNAIRDASPLGTLPVLQEFFIEDQLIDGGAVTRCIPFASPQIVGVSGSAVAATSESSYAFGSQRLFIPYGTAELTFDDGAGFSGTVSYSAATSPYEDFSCPWPSTFTAAATVTGTAKEGSSLTATLAMTNAPAGLAPSWVWHDAISGYYLGAGQNYTPDSFDVGRKPRATATLRLPGMQETTITSAATSAILGAWPASLSMRFPAPVTTGINPSVDVRGLPAYGPAPSFKYTWKLDGKPVATTDWNKNGTWLIPASARGKKLSVDVSVKAAGYETKTYAGPSTTVLGSFGPVGQVYGISGTLEVGRTVSVKPPQWSPTPTSYAYQWRRDGKAISGATSSTYKLASADAGRKITVAITPKRSGYHGVAWVTWAEKVKPLFATAPQPKVTGSPTVGATVKASVGSWSPTPTSLSYQWIRNGVAIAGATKSTYTLTSADAGKQVQVKVTAKRSGYSPHARYSTKVTIGKKLTAVTPTISGTAKAGSTLTVKRGTWGPGTVPTKVQWYVNGKAVSGATGSTFKVRPSDVYKPITVKVTGSKSGYTTTSRTSVAKKVAAIDYASCTDMRKHYPHGIAKSATVKNKVSGVVQGGITSTTFVSASLYALNDESDRDKDGWACEP